MRCPERVRKVGQTEDRDSGGDAVGAGEGSVVRIFQSVQEQQSENCWNGHILQMFAQLLLLLLSRSAQSPHYDTNKGSAVFLRGWSEVNRRLTFRRLFDN